MKLNTLDRDIAAEIKKQMHKTLCDIIIDEVKDLPETTDENNTFSYTTHSGRVYTEKPGNYSKIITRQMAHDCMLFHLMTNEKNEKLYDMSTNWMFDLINLSIELERSFDDLKGERPIIEIPSNMFSSLIGSLSKAKSILETENFSFDDFNERISLWINRVELMKDWYYVINQRSNMMRESMDAQAKEYSYDDTEFLRGLSDKDEQIVLSLIDVRKSLLSILVKLPIDCPKRTNVRNTLEYLDEECAKLLNTR